MLRSIGQSLPEDHTYLNGGPKNTPGTENTPPTEIPNTACYSTSLKKLEKQLFDAPVYFCLGKCKIDSNHLLLSFLGKQKIPKLPNPLATDALEKFSTFLQHHYQNDITFLVRYNLWIQFVELVQKNAPADFLDPDPNLRELQYRQIVYNLWVTIKAASEDPSQTNEKIAEALFALKTPEQLVPTKLRTDHIEDKTEEITSILANEYAKKADIYLLLLNWKNFQYRCLQNLPYTYYSEDPVERKQQYLKIANYLLLGLQEAEKHPSPIREQILDNLPRIILEDIATCLGGVNIRIQYSYLPACTLQSVEYALPIFPLTIVHRLKELAFKTTLDWATKSPEAKVGEGSQVHALNAFYQAENQREGLGFSQQTLGDPEAIATYLAHGRAYASSIRPYNNQLQLNKQNFLSPERCVQEVISEYNNLARDKNPDTRDISRSQQEELIEGLIRHQKWHLSILKIVFDKFTKWQEAIDKMPLEIQANEQERFDAQLRNFGLYPPFSRWSETSFIFSASKTYVRHHVMDSKGQLSEFGALLILQTAGLFNIPTSFPKEYQELLQQAKEGTEGKNGATEDLKNLLQNALKKRDLELSQVPLSFHPKPPTFAEIEKQPTLAYQLSKNQIQSFKEIELLKIQGALETSFRSIYRSLPVAEWPPILLISSQFVLQRLAYLSFPYEITDCLTETPEYLFTKDFFEKYAAIISQKQHDKHFYYFRWVPREFFKDPEFVLAVHEHLREVIRYIPWEDIRSDSMQENFLKRIPGPFTKFSDKSVKPSNAQFYLWTDGCADVTKAGKIGYLGVIFIGPLIEKVMSETFYHLMLNQAKIPSDETGAVARQIHNIGNIVIESYQGVQSFLWGKYPKS